MASVRANKSTSRRVPHTRNIGDVGSRVAALYGDSVDDYLRTLHESARTALGVIGSFIQLAELDYVYENRFGAFHVSEIGGHRMLYKKRGAVPIRIAFVKPNGDVCPMHDRDAYIPLAYQLANWVLDFKEAAEAANARTFITAWADCMSGILEAGTSFAFAGNHRGKRTRVEFVVTGNGDGEKGISVRIPFLDHGSVTRSGNSSLPFSRLNGFDEINLVRFLSDARAVRPPALVSAVTPSSHSL